MKAQRDALFVEIIYRFVRHGVEIDRMVLQMARTETFLLLREEGGIDGDTAVEIIDEIANQLLMAQEKRYALKIREASGLLGKLKYSV